MKAKEYYEKYAAELLSGDYDTVKQAGEKLTIEFMDEVSAISEKRKVSRPEALVDIIKELNQKWNALRSLFIKLDRKPVLAENGFRDLIQDQIDKLLELQKQVS